MKTLKKKLPSKTYLLFTIYNGNTGWYNRNKAKVETFIESLRK